MATNQMSSAYQPILAILFLNTYLSAATRDPLSLRMLVLPIYVQQYQWPNKAVIAFFTKLFMTFLCTSKKFILGQHSHSILLIVISLKDIVKHIKYWISNLSYVMPVILSFRPHCRISILLATDTNGDRFWFDISLQSLFCWERLSTFC